MLKRFGATAIVAGVVAAAALAAPNSGLKAGERVSPFHPQHVSGPLAGTDKCFPCTFQNRPQVQVWVNGDAPANVEALAKTLGASMEAHKGKEFKALIVFLVDRKSAESMKKLATEAGKKPGLANVAMAMLDKNSEYVANYKINTDPSVKNTVLVYKDWTVARTFVNLTADAAGAGQLNGAIASIAK